jgi:hypothetical protein
MKKPSCFVVLYRKSQLESGELGAIQESFPHAFSSRMLVQPGDLVIGRYSMVPFYKDMVEDLTIGGARPINSLQEHIYIADLGNYVADLGELTPKTWSSLSEVPKDGGPFVLKGENNSRKNDWSRSMFAKDFDAAGEVYSRLAQDGLIGYQKIYTRQYVPLMKLADSIGGCPITKEFRFFTYRGKVLSGGFYWEAFREDILDQGGTIPDVSEVPEAFLKEALSRVSANAPFLVMDVAQGADGRWWVIELNDGQQSGLSANDPKVLFSALRRELESEYGPIA